MPLCVWTGLTTVVVHRFRQTINTCGNGDVERYRNREKEKETEKSMVVVPQAIYTFVNSRCIKLD